MNRWDYAQVGVALLFSVLAIWTAYANAPDLSDPLDDCEKAFGAEFERAHYMQGRPVLLVCEYENGSALLTRPQY